MKTKVIHIGNSLGAIIPKIILDELGWKVGDLLDYHMVDHSLVVTKHKNQKKKS